MLQNRQQDPLPAEPRFDVPVPANGYRWWYVDGLSPDGREGVVVIAMIGNVFSPYFYAARATGPADPHEFCAINVGLYRSTGKRWALTERGAGALERGRDFLRVGPSRLAWRDGALEIVIEERPAPLRRPLSGRMLLRPAALNARGFHLDGGQRHRWRPIAPAGGVEVDFARPSWRWEGAAYFDTNAGCRALEDDFASWHWCRSHGRQGTAITYAVKDLAGHERALALAFAEDGSLEERPLPPEVQLPPTGWRIRRPARFDHAPMVLRTYEDTPFYARSLLADDYGDRRTLIMHESLSLTRFRSAWVRRLLPFRMGRSRS